MRVYLPALLVLALCLCGCQPNSLIDRSLIFSTHTSLGIEVSVSPQEMDSPAKLLIGYKRSEGVLNPVYYNLEKATTRPSDGNRDVNDFYRGDAYSVLAKFEGRASAGGVASSDTKVATGRKDAEDKEIAGPTGVLSANVTGGMTLSQWFATGKAAEILAQFGGSSALTDNPAVAAAAAAASTDSRGSVLMTDGETSIAATSVVNQLYTELSLIASGKKQASPEARAEAHRLTAILNESALVANVPAQFEPYATDTDAGETYTRHPDVLGREGPGFGRVIAYWSALAESVSALERIQGWIVDGKVIKLESQSDPVDKATKEALLAELAVQRNEQSRWRDLVRKDPAVATLFKSLAGEQ